MKKRIGKNIPLHRTIDSKHYLDGARCEKAFWLDFNPQKLKVPSSNLSRLLMEKDQEVILAARKLFPGGIDLSKNGELSERALAAATEQALSSKEKCFFNAGFMSAQGHYFTADILIKSEKQTVIYVVVRSTDIIKPLHIDNVGWKRHVLEECGKERKIAIKIMRLKKEFVLDGDAVRPEDLFTWSDETWPSRRNQPASSCGSTILAAPYPTERYSKG